MADQLDRGRKAFERRAWADALNELSAADCESRIEVQEATSPAEVGGSTAVSGASTG